MPATHRNRLVTAISNAPGAAGALTIASAAAGYRTFGAADNGLEFDVSIVDGTAWEICTGCVYTHAGTSLSRGTLEDSSTGSAIALSSAAVVTVTLVAGLGQQFTTAAVYNAATILGNNSTQSTTCPSGSVTKVGLGFVSSNPHGWWNTGNERFLPTVAGYYFLRTYVQLSQANTTAQEFTAFIRKNGSASPEFCAAGVFLPNVNASPALSASDLIYLNGTSDYLELFMYQSNGGSASRATLQNGTAMRGCQLNLSFWGV